MKRARKGPITDRVMLNEIERGHYFEARLDLATGNWRVVLTHLENFQPIRRVGRGLDLRDAIKQALSH